MDVPSSQMWKQAKRPAMDEGIEKMWPVHTNEHDAKIKRNETQATHG